MGPTTWRAAGRGADARRERWAARAARLGVAAAALLLAALGPLRAAATPPTARAARAAPAATLGGETIEVAAVDARCGAKCSRLVAEIETLRRTTLDALIEEALLAAAPRPTPTPVAVRDEEVERHRAAHADELGGPIERDRAAVRFLLERRRRRERDARLIQAARARTPVEIDAGRLATGGADEVVATVGGVAIRNRDVERRAALALYRLRGELARERLRQLEVLVEERLWADAARARGLTVEALRAEVARDAPPVTDADVDRHFESEIAPRDPAAVKRPERIRPYLEFVARRTAERAFLERERRARGVTVHLAEPVPPRVHLAPAVGGTRGAREPRVLVLLLTSYRGEASRRMWALARALADAPDVALAVRPLLPQWDPEAEAVAAAVRCADEQGRFWEMQEAAAGAPELPDRARLLALAEELGLDPERLERCMARPEVARAIAEESETAERLGLERPPVLLIGGRVLSGVQSEERVRRAVEEARADAPAAATSATATPATGAAPLSAPSSSASASP